MGCKEHKVRILSMDNILTKLISPIINLMAKEDYFDSLKIALIVGVILSLINQYDVIFSLSLNPRDILRICLNFLVPFCVASISRHIYINKQKKKAT